MSKKKLENEKYKEKKKAKEWELLKKSFDKWD